MSASHSRLGHFLSGSLSVTWGLLIDLQGRTWYSTRGGGGGGGVFPFPTSHVVRALPFNIENLNRHT